MKLSKHNLSYLLIFTPLINSSINFGCSDKRITTTNSNANKKTYFYLKEDDSEKACKYQIIEIDFWGDEFLYENRVYNLISSKQIQTSLFKDSEYLYDFLCISNDTAYLLNARKDTLNNTYKFIKDNVFFILNDTTVHRYMSMNLFGLGSELIDKYYDELIQDTVFNYSLRIYMSSTAHISKIKFSRKYGIFSLTYYNDVFGCEYQRRIPKSEINNLKD